MMGVGHDAALTELPNDPALPGLTAIREAGLAAIAGIGAGDAAELVLRGYSPGDRVTLEARLPGGRRVAVKAYASDPAPEARLYDALAAAGHANTLGVRAPPLLAWVPDLKLLVLGWLEGPPTSELIKDGQPERAGELAATWLEFAASLPLRLGPPYGAARVLKEAGEFVAMLEAGDARLGEAGRQLYDMLANTQPAEGPPHLVHGTLYTRHIVDLGDGPGVIDWQRFGQGPQELDAGTFLATVARSGLLRPRRSGEAARTEAAFLARTAGFLDSRALAWHRAAALLRIAGRMLRRRAPEKAQPLLIEATRLARTIT